MRRNCYRDNGELEALRKNIVALLFKQLTSTDAATVAEAEAGLGQLVATSKISKQLMQSSIRPVLNGISHYKHLKLHLLQGLVRLLKLMPGYFNVAVGAFSLLVPSWSYVTVAGNSHALWSRCLGDIMYA